MKPFPPPLSRQDEQLMLRNYMEGSLFAKQILIERNLRLVAHVIKKYQYLEDDLEDLISIGTIGLIKAISTFNPQKNARLATYACRCIENEILMMLRTKKKYNKEISLYEPIGTDQEGNEIQLYDVLESHLPDPFSVFSLSQDKIYLYEQIERVLTPRELIILVLRYGLYHNEDYTQREISDLLGISRSYVSRIEKTAIEKLAST